jgi:hypothetical protein
MKLSPIRTKSVRTSVHPIGKILQNLVAPWLGSPENEVYGNSVILNHYAGVTNKRIRGRYQHGWPAHSNNDLYYKNNFLPTFTWNTESEAAARANGWKNFKAIGAPWLYLLEILRADGWVSQEIRTQSEVSSTLWVYGRHSLRNQSSPDHQLLLFLESANVGATMGDICLLYFEDFDSLSEVNLRQFANLQIVTLGQRSSSFVSDAHLVRLYHLFRTVSRVKIDHPSTLALYALTLGVEVDWIRNESWLESSEKAKALGLKELYEFMQSSPENSLAYSDYAFRKLGKSACKSRSELGQILGWGGFLRGFIAASHGAISTLLLFFPRLFKIKMRQFKYQ